MSAEQVITDSKSIENIFQSFRASKSNIIIRHELKEYNAFVYRVSDVSITFDYKGNLSTDLETIEISTTTRDAIYFAICKVLNISGSEITVAYPSELEKGVKRKFKRVDTIDDVYLKFNVISNVEDNFNIDDNKNIPQQFAHIYKELMKPIPDIKIVLPLVAQELKKKAPLFEIKLYKENEVFSIRAKILSKYKKMIYINNVKESKSYLKDHQKPDLISFLPYIQELKQNNLNDDAIRGELINIMKEDISTSAITYICSPIILFNHAIGHIFLGVSEGSFSVFRDQDFVFVQTACDIISETLAKGKLHQLDTGNDFTIKALDLSAGGVLMELNDANIVKLINENMKLRIVLKVNDKEIKTIGRIRRLDKEDNKAIIGIKFSEIRWNDQEFVDRYVNRRIEIIKIQESQK